MKAVKITLAGRTQYLAYTGEAMFQLQEKFGTAAELLGAIGKNTRDGLSVACEAAAILAEQGELARRHLGYDKGPIIEAATIRATITPSEIAALKLAIPAAMERVSFLIRWARISLSDVDWNRLPLFSRYSRNRAELTMLPLWASAKSPVL